ncbi:MAG: V-type ATP synthase subunit E [Candidatus Anstonellaceae archaeon]
MSLSGIVHQIEKEAKDKALSILEEAKKQQTSIILEAKKQGKNLILSAEQQAKELSKNYHLEKISSTQNESNRIVQEAREEAIENALKEIWNEFVAFSKSPAYPKFLKKLAALAIEELEISNPVFVVNQKDAKIISGLGLKIGQIRDIRGGLIAQSKDEKVVVDYSFESIFEQKKPVLRAQIRQILLEKEEKKELEKPFNFPYTKQRKSKK